MARIALLLTGLTLGFGILLSPVTGFAANKKAAASSPKYAPGGTMTITAQTNHDCFDIHTCILGYTVNNALFSTLAALDSKNRLIPYLADSWKIKPKSIAFHIRRGSTCADGTPITPAVIKNSFQRMIDIKAPNNTANLGAGPFTFTANNKAMTFTVTSATPYAGMIYGFTNTFPGIMTGIVCPAGLADPTGLRDRAVGSSGPYTLVSKGASGVTLQLRSDFVNGPSGMTGKTLGVPATVTFQAVVDQTTIANLLTTGGLDVGQVSGVDVPRLLADKTLSRYIYSTATLNTLVFNHSPSKATSDPRVRQALITAVDRKDFVTAAAAGQGVLSTSIVTRPTPCFDPKTAQLAPQPSVARAQSILRSAGYTLSNGVMVKNGQPLTIDAVFPVAVGPGAEYLQGIWKQVGAVVNLRVVSQSLFSLALFNADFDVSQINASINQPYAGAMTSRYSGAFYPQGTNFARTSDQVLERAKLAAQRYVGEKSCKHWDTYQEQLWKEWHLLPLYAPVGYIFGKDVDLSRLAPNNNIQPYNIRRLARS